MRFYILYLYSDSIFIRRCLYFICRHSYGFKKKYTLISLDISLVKLDKHEENPLAYLSSAFDVVDHEIFLSRMQNSQDIGGAAKTIAHALKNSKLDSSYIPARLQFPVCEPPG